MEAANKRRRSALTRIVDLNLAREHSATGEKVTERLDFISGPFGMA